MRTKKVLLCVLALMVALMAMSVPALADGPVAKIGTTEYATLQEAIEAANTNDVIQLLQDITVSGQIEVTKSVTIDGGNHTITSNQPDGKYYLFYVYEPGTDPVTVNFSDLNIQVSGYQVAVLLNTDLGSVANLDNVDITSDGACIYSNGPGTANAENCTLTHTGAYTTKKDAVYYSAVLVGYSGVANLTDCTVYSTDNGVATFPSGGTINVNNTEVTSETTEATYVNEPVAVWVRVDKGYSNALATSSEINIEGDSEINGDLKVTNTSVGTTYEHGTDLVVTGGTFTDDPTPYLAEGVVMEDNGNGTYGAKVAVAQVGSTTYATLEEAFAAAQDGNTITLLANCAGNGIVVPQGKFNTNGLTVDFAGYTYDVTGTPVGSKGTETIGFQLLKDNKITFANGTITGNSNTNTALQRMIQNYSDLTLDNMTVSMVGRYYDQTTVSTCNGEFVVKDSTVSAPDYTWANISDPSSVRAAAFTVGTFASYTSASAEVKGSSTINGDISVDPSNDATNALILTSGTVTGDILMASEQAADATVTKADAFTQEAPAGYKWVDKGNGTAELAPVPPAAASVTITKKDAYVDYDGLGYLRYVSTVNVAAGNTVEYFGTWFIPENLLNDTTKEKATVKSYNTIENGKSFTADLLEIPHEALNRVIAGVSFVKVLGQDEVSTDVATATVEALKNDTSAE